VDGEVIADYIDHDEESDVAENIVS
jgi:hypothetical protein